MDIKAHTKWDLDKLFDLTQDTNIDDEIKIIKNVTEIFIKKWKKRKDYLKDPKILKIALDEYNELDKLYGKSGGITFYYHLLDSLDSGNPDIKAKTNILDNEISSIMNELRFFTHNISNIIQKDQNKFLKSKQLKEYKEFINGLFKKQKYILSEKEENILLLLNSNSYGSWVKMLEEFLTHEESYIKVKGKRTKVNFSETISLMNDVQPKTRDNAAKAFNKYLNNNKKIAEHEINNVLNYKKIQDQLRGHTRPDESRLISDNVTPELVDTLRSVVTKNYHIANKYYELKSKIMNVDKLKYHERNIPISKKTIKYDMVKGIQVINNVFNKLDPDFKHIFNDFIENDKIDFLPQKGKRHGAFCSYNRIQDPIVVLLNYTDELNDVLTLAHEMGHAVNFELIRRDSNALNYGATVATGEVASTFMEDFVLEEVLKKANNEEKLNIMMSKLNDDISTIFRQIAFYNFEYELHTKYRELGYLNSKDIGELFVKHMSDYMGHYVEQSRGSSNWWIYVSHFRMYFYVYSYASGQLISKSLQNRYRKNKNFMKDIKTFLSTGLEKSVLDTFNDLDIDLLNAKFWEDGVNEIEDYLHKTETLAKKLKKI